ncbi:DsbA family oxidoreductase [Ammoniphilus oxalaticus]|uniref:DsbA family oxidoreductase n=1 Tax=Ammoniphilus oxalaticus TaxID=66863 RepID=UPI0024823251|nr:DsbA family oxidoreductase [Ammoniphilus oxalaticus]
MGARRLEAALKEFAHSEHVKITYKSFELDPEKPKDATMDAYDNLATKYGMSREQAKKTYADMNQQAQAEGLDFQFDKMIPANTFDAHRLTLLATASGKQPQMVERLFSAYFIEGKRLSDRETLLELGEEVGLDTKQIAAMLDGTAYSEQVRTEQREAQELGVRAVPFYVIDRKYGISGAHPSEFFLKTLDKAWQESQPLSIVNNDDEHSGDACDETGCQIDPNNKS